MVVVNVCPSIVFVEVRETVFPGSVMIIGEGVIVETTVTVDRACVMVLVASCIESTDEQNVVALIVSKIDAAEET